jgi:hypothetical protein
MDGAAWEGRVHTYTLGREGDQVTGSRPSALTASIPAKEEARPSAMRDDSRGLGWAFWSMVRK